MEAKQTKKAFTITLPWQSYASLRRQADRESRTVAAMARLLIERGLKKEKGEGK